MTVIHGVVCVCVWGRELSQENCSYMYTEQFERNKNESANPIVIFHYVVKISDRQDCII